MVSLLEAGASAASNGTVLLFSFRVCICVAVPTAWPELPGKRASLLRKGLLRLLLVISSRACIFEAAPTHWEASQQLSCYVCPRAG